MIVLFVLGYFNRNKQNSYAALMCVSDWQMWWLGFSFVDRITLFKMLLFLIILPWGRGQLIQQEKATLDTCNYLTAVINSKWTYNVQSTLDGVSWSMAQLTMTPCLKDHLTPGQPYCLSDYLSLTERRLWQIICSNYTFSKQSLHIPGTLYDDFHFLLQNDYFVG